MAFFILCGYDYSRRKTRFVVGLLSDQFIDYIFVCGNNLSVSVSSTRLYLSLASDSARLRRVVISFRIVESAECFDSRSRLLVVFK